MKEGWNYKSVENCFTDIRNGANIKQFDSAEGIPITRIETLSNNVFNRDRMGYANIFDVQKYEKYVLQDGDILMSHINSAKYLGRAVAYRYRTGEQIIHGMNLLRLVPIRSTINPIFAEYYFKSFHFKKQISQITKKAVNQASFTTSDLKKITIPVPSLAEQERIVAELDLLTGIIDKQKAQLKELDTLAQSIFYDMFGDPVENEKGWEKKQLGLVCVSKKQIQRANKRFINSDAIQYIDISSIDNINNVITSTTSYVFGDAPSRAQQVVEIGDILISLVRPNLNNVAMVSEIDYNLVASSGFCVLRASREIVKEFLFFSVKMNCFTDYLMQRVSGANYPAVREDDITGYSIITPPSSLQESFAQSIRNIEKQKQSITRSIADTQKLFDYTMDKYFG